MFWFVLAVILLIIGVVIFAVNTVEYTTGPYRDEKKEFKIRWFSLIPLGLGLLLMVLSALYTQDPGEAIVIRSVSGKVVKTDTDPGWGMTAPWNSTIKFNIRNQRIEMFSNGGGDGKDGAVINAPLEGSSNAYVSITVRYSIRPDDVQSIYEVHKTQDNLLDNVLRPGLRDVVRKETAKFPPFEVKERRAELSDAIRDELDIRWGKMGVVVDNVDLGDLSLDEATEEAISRVNTQEAGIEEKRAQLEQAYIAAETTKTEAQAQADADQIIRCGATTATETQIVAGKEQEVTVVVPLSGEQCENRLNEQVLTSKWFDTLSELGAAGNMTILIPEDGTTPIVQLPAPQNQEG